MGGTRLLRFVWPLALGLLATPAGSEAPPPDLSLQSVILQSASVAQGQSLTFTLTFTSQNGFQGQVDLQVTEGDQTPGWLSFSPTSANLDVPKGGQKTLDLTVQVSPDAPTGDHTLKLRVIYRDQKAEKDLTLTVTRGDGGRVSTSSVLTWLLVTGGYLLLFLWVRCHKIALPSRSLALAQLRGLRAEYGNGGEVGKVLEEAKGFLENGNCLHRIFRLFLWNGAGEMSAWVLMHRAERLAAEKADCERVKARLRGAFADLSVLPEEKRRLWERALGEYQELPRPNEPPQPQKGTAQEEVARVLGEQGKPTEEREGSSQNGKAAERQAQEARETEEKSGQGKPGTPGDCPQARALLQEVLADIYDARDREYARLLTFFNKGTYLFLLTLGLSLLLGLLWPTGLWPWAYPSGPEPLFLYLSGLGGGLVSRLFRVVHAKSLPTDYGAYWVPLFLAPALGGVAALLGWLLLKALLDVEALGPGLKGLLDPPGAYGLGVALGFSERLFPFLSQRLETRLEGDKKGADSRAEGPEARTPQLRGRDDRLRK